MIYLIGLTCSVSITLWWMRRCGAGPLMIASMAAAWLCSCLSYCLERCEAENGFNAIYCFLYLLWRVFGGPRGRERRAQIIASLGLTQINLSAFRQQVARAWS